MDSLGLEFGPAEGREQKARQDGDDGNDDEEFDEGEGGRWARVGLVPAIEHGQLASESSDE
jgi:hypothetical protein